MIKKSLPQIFLTARVAHHLRSRVKVLEKNANDHGVDTVEVVVDVGSHQALEDQDGLLLVRLPYLLLDHPLQDLEECQIE